MDDDLLELDLEQQILTTSSTDYFSSHQVVFCKELVYKYSVL